MEVNFVPNKLIIDEFGRPSGVLILDKTAGDSAHDLVNQVRKKLNYKKVGHAGALDTFSTGLMIILVGKATKLSDKLMGMEKKYVAEMVLGISTETQDIEGKIVKALSSENLDENTVQEVIKNFEGGYEQYVSPFSSVKVAGKKLRKVLRDKKYKYKITFGDDNEKYIELFDTETGVLNQRIMIPKRFVEIKAISIESIRKVNINDLPYSEEINGNLPDKETQFLAVKFSVLCSKGTYIRQLAEDIGERLGVPASLFSLRRTSVGPFNESSITAVDSIGN